MPEDLKLAVRADASRTFKGSKVLLARAYLDGTLELLTEAWVRALGYGLNEFRALKLSQLLWPGTPATTVAAAVLDERNMGPVDLKLRCRDGHGKSFRLYRRLDLYDGRIYVVAVETLDP